MTIDIERQPTGTVPISRRCVVHFGKSAGPTEGKLPCLAAWVRLLALLTGLTPAYQMTPTETEALGAEPNEVKRQLVAMTAQLIAATTTD